MSLAFIIGGLSVVPSHAAELDALLQDAVRYANTPEKHAAKLAARDELKARMPDALRAGMDYAHGDNVMLNVLLMEWVEQLPSDIVVPVLLDYAGHERSETRRLALFFLGFHPSASNHAERIMGFLDDEECRGATIRTLGKWRVRDAVPAISAWLRDGKERVRVVSANALRDIGDPSAIPALVAALDDPVFTVRNTAARALVSFGEAAAGALRDVPDDTSPRAREMRRRCLADLDSASSSDSARPERYFTP